MPLLELLVHVDRPFFQIDIVHRQSAKFRDPQPGMEQDEDSFIISLVVWIVFNEVQENPHISL